MSKSLTPAVRRQIIAYDPTDPEAPSISQFCRSLGISRPSFYNVRDRYQSEGNAALNPRSRAPKQPARTFTDDAAAIVLETRQRLTGKGWDAGPKSIWHVLVDEAIFDEDQIPSISTIARILSSAGVVVKNPRKRPRTSFIRFQRAAAMELWQLDAFEFKRDRASTIDTHSNGLVAAKPWSPLHPHRCRGLILVLLTNQSRYECRAFQT